MTLLDVFVCLCVKMPSSMEQNTNKKGGPIWQPMVVPDQVRCTRPITIDEVNAVNFLPI